MILYCAVLVYPLAFPNQPLIVSGDWHSDCYEKLSKLNIPYHKSSVIEGFLTDKHKFLDRYDAKHEAAACGQINPMVCEGRALHAEDLWGE